MRNSEVSISSPAISSSGEKKPLRAHVAGFPSEVIPAEIFQGPSLRGGVPLFGENSPLNYKSLARDWAKMKMIRFPSRQTGRVTSGAAEMQLLSSST